MTWTSAENYSYKSIDSLSNSATHREEYKKIRFSWALTNGQVRYEIPPNPLGIFFGEDSSERSPTLSLQAYSLPMREGSLGINPLYSMVLKANFFSFTLYVMSLLALLFSYDLICGERENGTLKLLLSYGVTRSSILIAKWIGGFIPLIFSFVLSFIACLFLIEGYPSLSLSSGDTWSLLVAFALSIVFIGFFFTLGLMVSCLVKKSSTSIMVLLLSWVLLVLVIPGLSRELASLMTKSSSEEELKNRHTENSIHHEEEARSRYYLRSSDLRREYQPLIQNNPEEAKKYQNKLRNGLRKLRVKRSVERYESFRSGTTKLIQDTYNRQSNVQANQEFISHFSPVLLFEEALRDASSRYGESKKWFSEIQNIQNQIMDRFFKVFSKTGSRWGGAFAKSKVSRPELKLDLVKIEDRFDRILNSLLHLLGFSLFCFIVTAVYFHKMDVAS